jgi:DNA-binding SARP family transcriptional activator
VRFDLLSCRLFARGVEVRLTPHETAFLAFLALNAGGASREELSEQFFAHLGDGARNAIKVLVHRLREKIGQPSAIRYSEGRYSLDHSPAEELRALEREVLLGDGAAVLEPALREKFVESRRRLRQARPKAFVDQAWFERTEWRLKLVEQSLAVRIARDALASGDPCGALEYVADIVRSDLLDEDATEIHMRANIRLGRRAEAVAEFERYLRAIARESGGKPAQHLRALLRNSRDGRAYTE